MRTGRWSAPGRVNLIGEHVDYAAGLCLPFAIAQRTVVEVTARDDDRLTLRSVSEDDVWEGDLADVAPGRPKGWSGYVAGVLWALRAAGHPVRGMDVTVTDTVPLGSGLSSSAALESAVAVAADELFGLGLDSPTGRRELARACVRAENEIVGANTGGMDQAASLLCTQGHALLLDTRDDSTRQVPLPLAESGLVVLVVDTHVRHRHDDGQYGDRRAAVEAAAAALGRSDLRDASLDDIAALPAELLPRARHVVTEIARVQEAVAHLDAGHIGRIGPLLDASHASLAGDYAVSCPELDTACAAARSAGALGARMVGGGFGGSAIALVPAGEADRVTVAVRAAFDRAGFTVPTIREAVASAGAGRDG